MFTDIKLSDDLNSNFGSWCRNNSMDLGGISFSIFVLQAGAWPLGQSSISPFAIPQPLEKSVSNFEKFYNSKFNGRKLTWLHHLSSAELKLCFTKKSYSVSMGTYHMAILYLFESTNSLTYKEVQENTQLTEEQLLKHLQSLVDAKLILLQQSPRALAEGGETPVAAAGAAVVAPVVAGAAPELPASDPKSLVSSPPPPDAILSLNLTYSNKRTKFKITAVAQKEVQQQQEAEQTHASVDEDRKLYLQAAIVRIMKARKIIKHNPLIQEVIQQSKNRFTPSVTMIKKCIEALMEKQYLERTSNTTDEYSYVA
jgi:cullin 2